MSVGLVKYALHKAREAGDVSKVAKLEAKLAVEKRRYLKRLAAVLKYKADIYGPKGRIYAADAKFAVRDGKLFHGDIELNPDSLCDGHGRKIYADD